MSLTEHFTEEELGVAGCDRRLIANADYLCMSVMEAIRTQWGEVRVHDGYRDLGHNARVGGKTASYHLFEDGHAAADIDVPAVSIRGLFNWLSEKSGLPFDKVILETNAEGVAVCVHVQVDRMNPPRRLAYVGQTGAGMKYSPVAVK